MRKALTALIVLSVSLVMNAGHLRAEGLVVVGSGPAVYYSPSFDYGGWDAIISRRIAWGQHDPATFPYSDQGFYCVHPDYVFGNVLTVRSVETGVAVTCTVADMVAPADQAHWRAHAAIEVSFRLYQFLGLSSRDEVEVMAMPGG